ncbi:MAG: glycosyltransferase family 4 protein [Elusimicrobiota bacterium]|nr:glycosyltransferase family 4 protein [Endomicrobiia bacterium]MDW8165360.1 glycosyltransferase family 4 protein [Elusimicrobiota bacterium]
MRILFITPELPHRFGGGQRMYYQIKYLKEFGNIIDLITFKTNLVDETIKQYIDNIYFVEEDFSMKFHHKVKNLILFKAYNISLKLKNRIKEILHKTKYDIVHIHKVQIAINFIEFKNFVPVVIDLWAAGLKGVWYEVVFERNLLKKIIKFSRIPRYFLADTKIYKSFNNFFVVSEEAKSYIIKRYPNKKVYIVPNGIESQIINYRKTKPEDHDKGNTIIYTGDMGFFQNIDTVLFFAQKILPIIKKNIPNIKFFVVGRNPAKKILNLAKKDKSIVVTGFVDNIYSYLREFSVYVAPIRTGAGIRNKLLEALGIGMPVVSTKKATEGIKVLDDVHILFASNYVEFAHKVVGLLNSLQKRYYLGKNASELIEKNYLWENIVKEMIKYYQLIISDK